MSPSLPVNPRFVSPATRFEQGCTFLRAPGSSWATAAGADVTQASGIAPGAQWTKHACLQRSEANEKMK